MPLPSNAPLTAHFTAAELRADDPSASPGIVANCKRVAEFLEVIRAALGNSPIRVTSGYRSPAYNARVGGAPSSSHQTGLAADFVPLNSRTMYANYELLQSAGLPLFDQIIYYPVQGHIHIGLGAANRREIRIRTYEGPGGTPYLTASNLTLLPGYVADAVTAAVTTAAGAVTSAAVGSPSLASGGGPAVVLLLVALTLWLA